MSGLYAVSSLSLCAPLDSITLSRLHVHVLVCVCACVHRLSVVPVPSNVNVHKLHYRVWRIKYSFFAKIGHRQVRRSAVSSRCSHLDIYWLVLHSEFCFQNSLYWSLGLGSWAAAVLLSVSPFISTKFSRRCGCSLSTGFSSKLRVDCPYILFSCRLSSVFSPLLSFVVFLSCQIPFRLLAVCSIVEPLLCWYVLSVCISAGYPAVHTFNQFRNVCCVGVFPVFWETRAICVYLWVMLSVVGQQFLCLPVQFSNFFFFQLTILKRYLTWLYYDDGSRRFLRNVGVCRIAQIYMP